MQTELLSKRAISTIGEEITHELGAKMIQDYRKAHPTEITSFIVGKDIINQILAQPGCVGLAFHPAYNEKGEKTMVYIGLDQNGNPLLQLTSVNNEGKLSKEHGIVADRLGTRGGEGGEGGESFDWWEND